jgi:peptidoglycan hydrolase-like protein with peptidoglycan-binding domain
MAQLAQEVPDAGGGAVAAPSPPANSPEQIRKAQIELKRLECLKGRVDGKLGEATRQAVKKFWASAKQPPAEVVITGAAICSAARRDHSSASAAVPAAIRCCRSRRACGRFPRQRGHLPRRSRVDKIAWQHNHSCASVAQFCPRGLAARSIRVGTALRAFAHTTASSAAPGSRGP